MYAKVIAHTIFNNIPIISFEVKFPRMVLSHILVHRQLSRVTASSRAVSILKMIGYVIKDPAMPVEWGENRTGMRADKPLPKFKAFLCKTLWFTGRNLMICVAYCMHVLGLHKQIASRLLEPWYNVKMIITATELDNFFMLRDHEDAQPETRHICRLMREAMANSTPKHASIHIPYSDLIDEKIPNLNISDKFKIATALCAQISYRNFNIDVVKAESLISRLLGDGVIQHLSPFEHCATANGEGDKQIGNFRGWTQLRHQLELINWSS